MIYVAWADFYEDILRRRNKYTLILARSRREAGYIAWRWSQQFEIDKAGAYFSLKLVPFYRIDYLWRDIRRQIGLAPRNIFEERRRDK